MAYLEITVYYFTSVAIIIIVIYFAVLACTHAVSLERT